VLSNQNNEEKEKSLKYIYVKDLPEYLLEESQEESLDNQRDKNPQK